MESTRKTYAVSLYYKSPSCYNFMRHSLNFVLPGITTIRKWLRVIYLEAGFCGSYFKKFKFKFEHFSEQERECVLLVDEMRIKKEQVITSTQLDIFKGFQDFGQLGRSGLMGNEALVFMLRGLYSSWKVPFCFFISCGPTNLFSQIRQTSRR